MLEAKIEQAVVFKRVLDDIKDLVEHANFDCSEEGLVCGFRELLTLYSVFRPWTVHTLLSRPWSFAQTVSRSTAVTVR